MRSRSGEPPSISVELTERIHAILASKGLTLYQVSQQTAKRYGRSSPFFLPHNLYYDVRRGALTPSVFQVFSLSRTSGYRLSDWLRVVGIEIENIPRLQALMQRKRTAIIDIALTDAQDSVEWFRSRLTDSLVRRLTDSSVPAVAPLTQLLEPVGLARIASLARAGSKKFIYAKIGTEDALAFPELLPGSIVRINPELIPDSFPAKDGAISDRIFLLEHSNGLYCCRVRRVRENVIVAAGTKLSYAQVELRLSSEAKILGVVDFEIRSLLKGPNPEVPNQLAKLWKPSPLTEDQSFHQLLRNARRNSHLSFREAAAMSRSISDTLQDPRYRISSSSFCDYEVQDTPPRGLHKYVTLCCLYGLAFYGVLRAIDVPIAEAGAEAMPDRFVGRSSPAESEISPPAHIGFLEHLLLACEEMPFFLRKAIASFAGLPDISLEDYFWVGGERQPLHPYFRKGLLAVINRRRKTPFHFPSKPVWKQPVYLLLQRDGTYLCASCDVENSTLVIHPYTEHSHRPLQFRHHKDIEVVGQIVAIARQVT